MEKVPNKQKGPKKGPKKRLTIMEHMKTITRDKPEEWKIRELSREYDVSQAAIRRILISKFEEQSVEVKEGQDRKALEQRLEKKNKDKLSHSTTSDTDF